MKEELVRFYRESAVFQHNGILCKSLLSDARTERRNNLKSYRFPLKQATRVFFYTSIHV